MKRRPIEMSADSGIDSGGTGPKRRPQRVLFTVTLDRALVALVNEEMAREGESGVDWRRIGSRIGMTARQCRERYKNYLRPDLSNRPWTLEEDVLLEEKVRSDGTKWAYLTRYFIGRSHVSLKNRWSAIEYRRNHADHIMGMNPDGKESLTLSEPCYAYYKGREAEDEGDWG